MKSKKISTAALTVIVVIAAGYVAVNSMIFNPSLGSRLARLGHTPLHGARVRR